MSLQLKKKILFCRKCFWTWKYPINEERNTILCPNCGVLKDARNRREYSKKRVEKNPNLKQKFFEYSAQKNIEYSNKRNKQIRKRVLLLVGKGKINCCSCGCNDERLLEINHINGNGNFEYKKIGGPIKLWYKIASLQRGTEDLNILCRVCNALDYLERKVREKLPFEIKWKK